MSTTTLTPTELDILVEGIAFRVYGPLDPDYGWSHLDPIYDWTEQMLANGVAPNAADLATAWIALCEEDADAYDRKGAAAMSSTTTTRRAAIFEPSIDGQWLEDVVGSADHEADTVKYTVVMLTPAELTNARGALPEGYSVAWAEAGRYGDDTEGAVLVAEDGSITYAD